MAESLFREESEEARSNRWLGRVVLIRPLSFALATAAARLCSRLSGKVMMVLRAMALVVDMRPMT